MERYMNLSGKSGVVAYEIGNNSIKVEFLDGSIYTYDNQSAGSDNLKQMQAHARSGQGLNSFITRIVKQGYSSKSR